MDRLVNWVAVSLMARSSTGTESSPVRIASILVISHIPSKELYYKSQFLVLSNVGILILDAGG